jgi:hypothetical protein
VFIAHVFDYVPETGVDKELFVIAEAMEEIEDWKAERFVGVEGGWKDDAIGNGAGEDFAGDGVALDAAWGGLGWDGQEEEEEDGEERAT